MKNLPRLSSLTNEVALVSDAQARCDAWTVFREFLVLPNQSNEARRIMVAARNFHFKRSTLVAIAQFTVFDEVSEARGCPLHQVMSAKSHFMM